MYVLRYRSGVPLKERKHVFTVGQHASYGDACDSLERVPAKWQALLDIVER